MERPLREIRPASRLRPALAMLVAALGSGCSFNLSSLSPADKDAGQTTSAVMAPPAPDGGKINPQEAQLQVTRAAALAQAGKTADALAAYNAALDLDPHSAPAFQGRAMLYLADKQYDFAIADFTSASGLRPQQADPLLGRAQCYLALGKMQEAAADLDEASQVAPGNAQVWMTRAATYEKLGDRAKAADSYSRAALLRPRDEAARSGVLRNGGKLD